MRPSFKRWLLSLGVLMLVSGWGTTRYAEARQEGLSDRSRDKAWKGEGDFISGAWIYALGIGAMAAGAIVVVFNRD